MTKMITTVCATLGICITTASLAYQNFVEISGRGSNLCIRSNDIPNHRTGRFPNPGNPHSISSQNINVCVPAHPRKGSSPRSVTRGAVGIAMNGVLIRPETADYWDPRSPRGHSRNPASGWNLEGMGSGRQLGLDWANAHVDERGTYHYHGKPPSVVKTLGGSQIGYAADGFEIHYVSGKKSGYRLKQGNRPSGPGGRYDGSYVEDWEYVGGAGRLDRCNGGTLNGKYVYFITDTFPFFPRCLWGATGSGFRGH